MLRSSLFTASAFALVASASAQTLQNPLAATQHRVPGVVKHAGTYHVATGTWTRETAVIANFGATDNVYSNTADSGYYSDPVGPTGPLPGGFIYDEGGIPGLTNPGPFAGTVTSETYTISSFGIGYCDLDANPGVSGWKIDFYEDYSTCLATPPTPVGTVTVTGFPSNGCWTADIDMTGMEFDIIADGGAAAPGWDGDPTLDSFGWGHQYAGTGAASAGFLLRGDPQSTDPGYVAGGLPLDGTNTYYGATSLCAGVGSGYLTDDATYFDDLGVPGGIAAGCYFYGGYTNLNTCGGPLANSYASWYMEMNGAGGTGPGTISGPPICTSLANSTGVPATMQVTGSAVPANNDAVLEAMDLPANQFGIFVAGRQPAASPIMSGNGLICIDLAAQGGLGRMDAANQIKNSGSAGVATLDTNAGEWDLSMIETSTGSYAAMAGITSYFQFWYRDNVGSGFNFTDAVGVTWQ